MIRNIPRDDKIKFNMSTFMEFIYSKEHQGQVVVKNLIGGLNQHTFHLKKFSAPPTLLTTLGVMEKVPINKKKINDIQKLRNYIPEEVFEEFYSEIFEWPTCDNEETEVLD
ncbi:hypothetical protein J6590_097103 [Homalodisca vitripennis]|nr:hypothetical protein J6590_097103 [Homalodisca vitripennis]